MRYLLENGADSSRSSFNGITPIQTALDHGHDAVADVLKAHLKSIGRYVEIPHPLKNNSHPKSGSDKWSIAQLKMVFDASKRGNIEQLKELVDAGAPIDCTPYGSQTPA